MIVGRAWAATHGRSARHFDVSQGQSSCFEVVVAKRALFGHGDDEVIDRASKRDEVATLPTSLLARESVTPSGKARPLSHHTR